MTPSPDASVCAAGGSPSDDGRSADLRTVLAVTRLDGWPAAETLMGARLRLEPLRVEHAEEMAPLFDDPSLHLFIGGVPATVEELRDRYQRQVVGWSADRSQRWLNWVVRRREDGRAVGTVQATAVEDAGSLVAEVAWVIAAKYQRLGYAREAARIMVTWMKQCGANRIVAHVHPQHDASISVARAIGLAPTTTVVDGEVRWET